MASAAFLIALGLLILILVAGLAFLVYVVVRYERYIARIFDEPPMFLPVRVAPEPGSEEVRFRAEDGVELAGTYWSHRAAGRSGVIVFCHELLSDRWSALAYADFLRDLGFDLFAFDFRNHGDSAAEAGYQARPWVTDRELRDLRGALAYLKTRPDADSAGVGLFGVSRGGSAALCVASNDPTVWAVATDGAFPTSGTMLSYILRWAEIYAGDRPYYRFMPVWVFGYLAWTSRRLTERRWRCSFPRVERAVARLAPRPWLMIHGEKDTYISTGIARALFARAREPKELWIVPGAKHNRCRELDPSSYRARLSTFFSRSSPRRTSTPPPADAADPKPTDVAATVPG